MSEAYLSGWMDRLFGSTEKSFVHNRELARWEEAAERLDYYRGHHAGREAFLLGSEEPCEAERIHALMAQDATSTDGLWLTTDPAEEPLGLDVELKIKKRGGKP